MQIHKYELANTHADDDIDTNTKIQADKYKCCCIETLLRSAAPGGGSGKGEQTENRRKNENCPKKHQIEKTDKDKDQNRKSKKSTSCVVV